MSRTIVANDPEPHVALPGLYGAPAYARPPRPVSDSIRPFDPDDLPIEADRTEEERQALAGWTTPDGTYAATDATSSGGPRPERDGAAATPRRFTLRVLTERVRRPNR